MRHQPSQSPISLYVKPVIKRKTSSGMTFQEATHKITVFSFSKLRFLLFSR
jgi:hypothetical protein